MTWKGKASWHSNKKRNKWKGFLFSIFPGKTVLRTLLWEECHWHHLLPLIWDLLVPVPVCGRYRGIPGLFGLEGTLKLIR